MKRFETELAKDDWTQVRPEVEVKKVAIPQGEETYILCRTAGRKEKEQAIRKRFSSSMEKALKALENAPTLQAASAEELWSKYMQLTEAEASFRALKSELSIRPLSTPAHFLRILSMAFPLASSSTSLSR